MREVIPTVRRRFDTDPRRVAVGGISMGGYGAYHLGLRHPGRFCAVGGHSAGLWLDESEEFAGAFDNRADYERNDVLAAVRADPDAFGDTRIWNDYGDEDWFVAGNAAFVSALRGGGADLTAHVWRAVAVGRSRTTCSYSADAALAPRVRSPSVSYADGTLRQLPACTGADSNSSSIVSTAFRRADATVSPRPTCDFA